MLNSANRGKIGWNGPLWEPKRQGGRNQVDGKFFFLANFSIQTNDQRMFPTDGERLALLI